ncbi:MAG: M23 family metallopeptidase [Spirochaetes bacterium]|nr:M23 family metallopeptidase [Spirochaetota bacterium]
MKKIYTILIILLFYLSARAEQIIYFDNEEIQGYKGKLGKWIQIESANSINSLSKKYLTSVDDIYSINNINRNFIKNYYFIPFSEDYLKELEEKNIRRTKIISREEEFSWPIENVFRTTSVLGFRNGKFHPGLDLPISAQKPILAAMEGLIIFSGYADGYGRIVTIEHRNNFTTRYAHNYANLVKKGDFVKKGQIIALSGSTGNSTGNHLHFELRCKDIPMDPLDFLPQKNDLQIIHTLKNWK